MIDIICGLIAKDGLTINQIVNSQFMSKAFEKFGWTLPKSCSTISKIIIDRAEIEASKVATQIDNIIKEGQRFSLVIDEWTSIACKRFLSIILCGTKNINLGLATLEGSLTSENLIEALNNHLNKFNLNLNDHIVGIICDGAAVMQKLQKSLPVEAQICYAHAIHLSVTDVFVSKVSQTHIDSEDPQILMKEKFERAIHSMNILLNSLSHSALLQESLNKYQINDSVPQLKPIIWCKTRWNSLLHSVERFLTIYPQIQKVFIDHNSKKIGSKIELITKEDLLILNEICQTLKPVEIGVMGLLKDSIDLLKTEKIIEYIRNKLNIIDSATARQFLIAFEKRINSRKNINLISSLNYLAQKPLTNAEYLDDDNVELFLENLYNRLFPQKDLLVDKPLQIENNEAMDENLDDIIAGLYKPKAVKINTFKESLSLFKNTNQLTPQIEKLWDALKTVHVMFKISFGCQKYVINLINKIINYIEIHLLKNLAY